jgi:hypothetical protein
LQTRWTNIPKSHCRRFTFMFIAGDCRCQHIPAASVCPALTK